MVRLVILLMIGLSCNAQYTAYHGLVYNNQAIGYLYDDKLDYDVDIFIPDTFRLMSDVDFIISDDAITMQKIAENRVVVDYVCNVGVKTTGIYTISETVVSPTYYNLTVNAYYVNLNDSNLIESKSAILEILPNYDSGIDTTKFLFVGNSLTEAGSNYFLDEIKTNTNDSVLFYGTKGTPPYNNEGIAGKTWWWFTYYFESPFWNGDSANITYYRNINDYAEIDYLFVKLGINDILVNTIDTTHINDVIMPRIEKFISTVLADDSTYNVVIVLEPKCENLTLTGLFTVGWDLYKLKYGYAYDENYYMYKMQYLWNKINDTYGNFNYSNNVFVISGGLNVDRASGYNYNALHPIEAGYRQLGKSYAAYVNYLQSR